jgi:hypothetical protein
MLVKALVARSPAMVPYVEGSVAQKLTSTFPLASRCCIGFWSGTLPLVKPQNATALARRGLLPSSLVAPVKTGGKSKQSQATMPLLRSVPISSKANAMAAAQTATPNPSHQLIQATEQFRRHVIPATIDTERSVEEFMNEEFLARAPDRKNLSAKKQPQTLYLTPVGCMNGSIAHFTRSFLLAGFFANASFSNKSNISAVSL